MDLKTQRRLAASVLGCSGKRVRFDPARLNEIKEAITKADFRCLIRVGALVRVQAQGVSRGRARYADGQRRKGLRKGPGSRKAKPTARLPGKRAWVAKIRVQRAFIAELREKDMVTKETYKDLYRKSKGGFFRSKRHIKLFIDEHRLVQQKPQK